MRGVDKAETDRKPEDREPHVYRFPDPMKPFTKRDEDRFIEAGRRYYATAFPNPDRVGCPDPTTMEALVHRKLDRAIREQIDSHMMHCSPCFNDYVRVRQARERSGRLRKLGAIAALIVLALASWIVVRSLVKRSPVGQPGTRDSTNLTYQADLLDLRNKAALRGNETNENEPPALLPAAALNLSIYLPTGSEPGEYELEVTQGPGEPLLKAQGQANLRDHIAVLEVQLDLHRLHPGPYLFWIREGDSSWSYYPVLVQARP